MEKVYVPQYREDQNRWELSPVWIIGSLTKLAVIFGSLFFLGPFLGHLLFAGS